MENAMPLKEPMNSVSSHIENAAGDSGERYSCALRSSPGKDAFFLALLAVVETMTRLNRHLPVRMLACPGFDAHGGVVCLSDWPEQLRQCPAGQVRHTLLPLLISNQDAAGPSGPHLLLTLHDGKEAAFPSTADASRGATVYVDCRIDGDALQIEVRCSADDSWQRMKPAVAEMTAELLRELLADPDIRAEDAQGIGAVSRQMVLCTLAGQAVDNGGFVSIPAMIEKNADRNPERPALSFDGRTLTYRQFDELANGLAAALAARGIGKGDVVPVMLVNGLEMPIAYHALMKTGAAFVPFDPAWPSQRIDATLNALSPKLILCAGLDAVPQAYLHAALVIDTATLESRADRPNVVLQADDPIYGIFTSGTTGTPKCAMNRHAGLTNRFLFMTRYFKATGDEVVLQNSKHTFDSSVWQLFWPLTTGAHAVIPAQGEFLNLDTTIDTIETYGITMTDFVPSIFNMMVSIVERSPDALRRISTLRQLIVGGEEMNPQMVYKLQDLLPGVQVTNGYGPTEASIGMVFHTVAPADGDTIPLGRPIDNCYAVILDQDLHLLPQGAMGEIVIGGICLGAGYFADARRTNEVFIANPFPGIPGERLYRTGDLGYYGENGKLYFVGRKDFQVKIGGVRIELGEVEAAAERCPHVRQARVLVARQDTGKALALFASGTDALNESELRDRLRSSLPRTNLPRYYFLLPKLPLTDNGKVDRKRLQQMLERKLAEDADMLKTAGIPTLALGRVLHIFRSVLQKPDLSATDNFIEAGGDSLQALNTVLELEGAFNVKLSVQDLFNNPTPEAMCHLLETMQSGTGGGDNTTLMEQDAVLPADIHIGPAPAGAEVKTVLLTGATGFIGSRILYELLTRTALRVVCLCRAEDDRQAMRRVIEALGEQGLWRKQFDGRLEAFAGDLGEPRLGLLPNTWSYLASTCDLILHNGAMVNFLFDYRAHRAANVLGTQELLRLAMEQRVKPLHYISTLGVLDCEASRLSTALQEEFDPAGAVMPRSGYSQSKWVAERCLLKARRKGAPVTIFRLGEVMPSADNGYPNRQALTHFLLSAFYRLGVCPMASMRSDYTPVDYVAVRVVAAVSDREMWGRTLHIFHSESVCFSDVLARIGTHVARVSCTEFMARLEQAIHETRQRDLVTLRALLPQGERDELALQKAFSCLLVDNSRLFLKENCRKLERRWGMADEWLNAAISAYRDYLEVHAGQGPRFAADVSRRAFAMHP